MPVPVATTHPLGKGLAVAKPEVLQSEGPFARMARLKAEAEAQQKAQQQEQPQAVQVSITASAVAASPAAEPAPAASAFSIAVSHLDFSYPGLGERRARSPRLPPPSRADRAPPGRSTSPPPPRRADGRPIPGQPPLISDMNLSLQPGSRCLLLGANGAGKTTLLKILGGKHMVR
jgi:CCR4-NOT complex subunit CAF16